MMLQEHSVQMSLPVVAQADLAVPVALVAPVVLAVLVAPVVLAVLVALVVPAVPAVLRKSSP